MNDPQSSSDLRRQIADLVASGKKIEAIKVYRAATGQGLKESKDYIDAIAMGKTPPVLPPNRSFAAQQSTAPPVGGGLTPDVVEQIRDAMARGRKIEAVKLYRDATGSSLKDSKEYVEAMATGGIPPSHPATDHPAPPISAGTSSSRSRSKEGSTHPHATSTGGCFSMLVASLIAVVLLYLLR